VGSAGTKKKNKNVFKKVYPYIRRRPVYTYELENETVMETAILTFTNESSKTYVFEELYSEEPTITAIAVQNEAGDNANVNLIITNSSVTQCTIEASDEFSGYVSIQVIMVVS